MADLGERLAQAFGTGPAGAAVQTCCNDVGGEWAEYPKLVPDGFPTFEGLDGVRMTTTMLGDIPKGLAIYGRFHVKLRIQGKLRCKCWDDGRTLSETSVDLPWETDVSFPVGSVNLLKKLVPWIGWFSTIWELAEALKQAWDFYSENPELAQKLIELAGEAALRAVREVANSANTLCRNKHPACASALVA